MVCRRVQCWAQCFFCCTPLILWSWFVVLVCWPHAYADDLQVYCHMNVGSEQIMLQRFRDCADSVSRWMSSNRLKLNPSKTEVTELIWFYSGRRQLSFVENEIELFGSRIAPVHTVRDLGVMLDSNMTMSQHVLRVCQNCYFQIRLIRRLGKALSVESKLLLVHALVHSRLDYCNSVLVRLPWSLVQKLQLVCVEFCCSFDFWLEAL